MTVSTRMRSKHVVSTFWRERSGAPWCQNNAIFITIELHPLFAKSRGKPPWQSWWRNDIIALDKANLSFRIRTQTRSSLKLQGSRRHWTEFAETWHLQDPICSDSAKSGHQPARLYCKVLENGEHLVGHSHVREGPIHLSAIGLSTGVVTIGYVLNRWTIG